MCGHPAGDKNALQKELDALWVQADKVEAKPKPVPAATPEFLQVNPFAKVDQELRAFNAQLLAYKDQWNAFVRDATKDRLEKEEAISKLRQEHEDLVVELKEELAALKKKKG